MRRYTFTEMYIEPLDMDLDMTAAVLDHLARTFAAARAHGAEIEPDAVDRARAERFTIVGPIVQTAAEWENLHTVTVEASDSDMNVLEAALKAVQ